MTLGKALGLHDGPYNYICVSLSRSDTNIGSCGLKSGQQIVCVGLCTFRATLVSGGSFTSKLLLLLLYTANTLTSGRYNYPKLKFDIQISV